MSDGTRQASARSPPPSQTHTPRHNTHTRARVLYARPYAEKWGVGKWESSSALLFKQPSHSLPFLPSSPSRVPREQPAGYFSDKENRRAQQMHELKFFKSSSRLKDNKKREGGERESERRKERRASARFFLVLGRSEITARDCARRQRLPNHTNQRPHCVDYLVNLLMPLSSIAGVNVPGFHHPTPHPTHTHHHPCLKPTRLHLLLSYRCTICIHTHGRKSVGCVEENCGCDSCSYLACFGSVGFEDFFFSRICFTL